MKKLAKVSNVQCIRQLSCPKRNVVEMLNFYLKQKTRLLPFYKYNIHYVCKYYELCNLLSYSRKVVKVFNS